MLCTSSRLACVGQGFILFEMWHLGGRPISSKGETSTIFILFALEDHQHLGAHGPPMAFSSVVLGYVGR